MYLKRGGGYLCTDCTVCTPPPRNNLKIKFGIISAEFGRNFQGAPRASIFEAFSPISSDFEKKLANDQKCAFLLKWLKLWQNIDPCGAPWKVAKISESIFFLPNNLKLLKLFFGKKIYFFGHQKLDFQNRIFADFPQWSLGLGGPLKTSWATSKSTVVRNIASFVSG